MVTTRRLPSLNTNGMVLYEGPSMIDGQPIVVIIVGLKTSSTNSKTGGMCQTYILRADVDPIEAIRTMADASICGGCPHRGSFDRAGGRMVGRSCYVQVGKAPLGVWRAWMRGRYATCAPADLPALGRDRLIRLGAYGDPAAAPFPMWSALVSQARGFTGYTHQWKSARLRDVTALCQASCDTERDLIRARALGLGTFRVTAAGAAPLAGEIVCPASAEAGKLTTCDQCRMCDGSGRNIVIQAHGAGAGYVTKRSALPVLA
jgi:hypothetical protein